MSGYFSRIARAGGARFSGEGVRRSAATKASTTQHLAPIDSEATAMVSPGPVPPRDTGPGKKKRGDGVIPKETRRERSADRTKPVTGLGPIASPSRSDTAIPPDRVAEETRLIDTRGNPAPPGVESPEDLNAAANSTEVKHRRKTNVSDSLQIDAVRPVNPEKRFFENTAAIVEGRPAEPDEAQTIVLREVQEWIAAGHIPSAEIVPDDTDERALPDRDERPEPHKREPGVVRIVDRDRPDDLIDTEHKTSTQSYIEEQNFEVSIGSISVVVEGDETLPQPAQAVVTRPAPAQESTRRVSRLSRHYL